MSRTTANHTNLTKKETNSNAFQSQSIKNHHVEFYRFVFTLVICIYHAHHQVTGTSYANCGHLAVEFFFALSGFLLATSYEKYVFGLNDNSIPPENQAVYYLKSRLLRLYPEYLFAFATLFVYFSLVSRSSLYSVLINLFRQKWEILMLQMLGLPVPYLNHPLWYLPPLVFVSFLLYYFMALNPRRLFLIGAPTATVLLYGYLIQKYHTLNVAWSFDNIVCTSLIRAAAGLCLGIFCFVLYKKLCNVKLTVLMQVLLLGIEITSVLLIFYCMSRGAKSDKEAEIILGLLGLLPLLFLPKTWAERIFSFPVWRLLGGICYSMYLNHFFVYSILLEYFRIKSLIGFLVVYIVLVILYSALVASIVKHLLHVGRLLRNRIFYAR